MQYFTSEELQRQPAEVQQAALIEPTMITFHGKPRLVMMSFEEYDRLCHRRHTVIRSGDLSDSVVTRMQAYVDAHPSDEELGLVGGLLDSNDKGGSGPAKR
jgi:hypothetical protein